MTTKLFVGSLAFSVTDDELRGLFETVGNVLSAKVIMDRYSNRSKGIGFVEMGSADEARAAISELHGKELSGRSIVVSEARPQENRTGGSSGERRPYQGSSDRGNGGGSSYGGSSSSYGGGRSSGGSRDGGRSSQGRY